MPKVEIYKDERYPDYSISLLREGEKFPLKVIEISDEELAEYERINQLYGELQAKMREWEKRRNG